MLLRQRLAILAVCSVATFANRATAQTYTNLYPFSALTNYTNNDGAAPQSLVLSGGKLYGTAATGGAAGFGTIFSINTDGTDFTNLYTFTNGPQGAYPYGQMVLAGNTLYGVAADGGAFAPGEGFGAGTVFSINTDGTGFTVLHTFSPVTGLSTPNSDGAFPYGGLALVGGTLYGTTTYGGPVGNGAIFAVNTNGSSFTNLYYFRNGGDDPVCTLVSSGGTLYGTSSYATASIFAISTNGAGFTVVHSIRGQNPIPGVVLMSNTLYGTDSSGVYSVNTDGAGFTYLTNLSDISTPVVVSGNTIYGTTPEFLGTNHSYGPGILFSISTDGTGFTNLHNFTDNGNNPNSNVADAGLILSGNTLYGTRASGGAYGSGIIFSYMLPPTGPELSIALSGTNAIVTWPTNFPGFTLQVSSNLAPPSIWTAIPQSGTSATGQNMASVPISGAQQFYRLSNESN